MKIGKERDEQDMGDQWNGTLQYRMGERTTKIEERDGVVFLTYDLFREAGVTHAVSTRIGGVSQGYLSEMNLSFTRGDDPACVEENHRRFAWAIGYPLERLVLSDQIHKTTIYRVDADALAGKDGRKDWRAPVAEGVDGLMTDVPGIPLMTVYADCVPLLFYDKRKRIIGMAHSGWRGTVARIGAVMLGRMAEEYGTIPADVIVAIGPSICQECYEVDRTVWEAFDREFGEPAHAWFRACVPNHFLLDLAEACRYTLTEAGVPEAQIAMPDLCTCCNPKLLFSHRASAGKRGNLGAVMMLGNAD